MRKLVMFSAYIAAIFTLNAAYADWEWWNEDGIEWNLNKKVTFGAAAEQKFKNDMKDIYCYNFEAGLSCECNQHLIFGAGYKFEREREYICEDTWEDWLDENRLQGDVIFKWEWRDFKFSDRNRFEYRILEDRDNKWRYRNRIKIKRLVNRYSFEITPYLSEEIFYDFYEEGFYKNRLSFGVCKELTSFLELDIYYMRESCKEINKWNNSTNVFGTILVFCF